MSPPASCPVRRYLAAHDLTLPHPNPPLANYVSFVRRQNDLYISGQGPVYQQDEICGQLGDTIGIDDGVQAARWAALNIIGLVGQACDGDFSRVHQCIQLSGFVNAVPGFDQHPQVLNGASDLIAGAFGERGRHSRVAIGVASLPRHWCIEVSAIFALAP